MQAHIAANNNSLLICLLLLIIITMIIINRSNSNNNCLYGPNNKDSLTLTKGMTIGLSTTICYLSIYSGVVAGLAGPQLHLTSFAGAQLAKV